LPGASGTGLRCGLYGGAFDPPHLGHVAMARAFAAQCQLDRLFIMPTGQAWHKATQPSAARHRAAMCRLAFAQVHAAQVSELELNRAGPTYTVDTLHALQGQSPGAQWFVLMGWDQWARFTTWHRWQSIAELATLVVAERGCKICADEHSDENFLIHPSHPALSAQPLRWQPVDVSSTAVREQLARAAAGTADMSQLLPDPVASYISQHQLYQNTHV